jgi:hypothetical protein
MREDTEVAKKRQTFLLKIADVFLAKPVGHKFTVEDLLAALNISHENQRQFERRLRDVRAKLYDLKYENKMYWLASHERRQIADTGGIGGTLRAEILNAANGRCGMCGKTIADDGIKLVVDHRVPRNWGGKTDRANLWAICQDCNIQKRDFFATLPEDAMASCMGYELPIQRIGELLKHYKGKMVSRKLLEVAGEGQDEWTRRLRELRELGWKIERIHDAGETGKYAITYRLIESKPWPDDIPEAIRKYRRNVANRRQSTESEPDE